jgi:6-phosphogluconolactonase
MFARQKASAIESERWKARMAVWNVYVGTFTAGFQHLRGEPSEGVERLVFDNDTGVIEHLETIKGIRSPQYLTVHPSKLILYAAEFATGGAVVVYAIQEDGSLGRVSTFDALGDLSVSVTVHPSGRYGYVANWGSGGLTGLALDDEGQVTSANVVSEEDPPDGKIFSEARPHQFIPTPGGNGVLAAYSGWDEVVTYSTDASGVPSSIPVSRVAFQEGSAPRHFAFHPSGRIVYVVGEHDSMLHLLDAEAGIPRRYRSAYGTVPSNFEGSNRPTELVIHPLGQTLYVANRGSNSIARFSLDEKGDVQDVDFSDTLGVGPRGIRFDPTGAYLFVVNCPEAFSPGGTGNIAVFGLDDDRKPYPLGNPVPLHAPSSIAFSRA